jgi:hypothetical protein
LDGISAAMTANTAGQVQAAIQVFALKQANNAAASTVAVLLQTLASPSAPGLAHMGQHVDSRA